jgi:Ser/Thr protein kinase RdoA (MazF antagonist)
MEGAALFMGSVWLFDRRAFNEMTGNFHRLIQGRPVVGIHGDIFTAQNALFENNCLTGIIDPGAMRSAPREVDLSWTVACEVADGADPSPLLGAYGDYDAALLERLMPLMIRRRLLHTKLTGDLRQQHHLENVLLSRRCP